MRFIRFTVFLFGGFLAANLLNSTSPINAQPKKGEKDPVGEIRAFKGHEASVRGIGFTPDGKKLFSVGDDKTIRSWDLVNEKAKNPVFLDKLQNSETIILFPAKPATAKYFFTAGANNNKITRWDSSTKKPVMTYGDVSHPMVVVFSPDHKYLACGTGNSKVIVWDATTGAKLKEFDPKQGHVHAVVFSPDSKKIAACTDDDGSLRMWEVVSGKQVWRYKPAEKKPAVMGAIFTPDGKTLITGNQDHVLRIFDLSDKEKPVELKGHTSNIFGLDISKDGKLVASASEDKTVRVWDLEKRESIHEFKHEGEVYCVVFSPDGKRIASCGRDEMVRLWGLGQ